MNQFRKQNIYLRPNSAVYRVTQNGKRILICQAGKHRIRSLKVAVARGERLEFAKVPGKA